MPDCGQCDGLGICILCSGSMMVEWEGSKATCSNCSETGNCPQCNGTGKVQ